MDQTTPCPSIGRLYIDPLLKDKRRSQREKKKRKFAGQKQGPPPVHMLVLNKMKKDNINNRRKI
jgi:hypothetical protein